MTDRLPVDFKTPVATGAFTLQTTRGECVLPTLFVDTGADCDLIVRWGADIEAIAGEFRIEPLMGYGGTVHARVFEAYLGGLPKPAHQTHVEVWAVEQTGHAASIGWRLLRGRFDVLAANQHKGPWLVVGQ